MADEKVNTVLICHLVFRSEAEAQPVCLRIGYAVGEDDNYSTSRLPGPTVHVVLRVTTPKESGPPQVSIVPNTW